MSLYEEISHIPLFAWHPAFGTAGTRSSALTQTIDFAPTFLDLFGAPVPDGMQGRSLLPLLRGEPSDRDAAIFGYFGGAVNVTDGRFVYHRYPLDLSTQEIYQDTLMPQHIWTPFSTEELAKAELSPPLSFTKGVPVLKVPMLNTSPIYKNYGPGSLLENETRLYDLSVDPGQAHPLQDQAQEARLTDLMARLMHEVDAPRKRSRGSAYNLRQSSTSSRLNCSASSS